MNTPIPADRLNQWFEVKYDKTQTTLVLSSAYPVRQIPPWNEPYLKSSIGFCNGALGLAWLSYFEHHE